MRVLYMSREYPPHVYGGAGVHLEHLAQAMARRVQVEVKCFGEEQRLPGNPAVSRYPYGDAGFSENPERVRDVLRALETCLRFNALPPGADVVHCHTWYAHWGGMLAKLGYGLPLVVTVHSLEPLRPWKREQLGRGYDLSSWIERTTLEHADAVIAVSESDRHEILRRFAVQPDRVRVVPNGVDTDRYRKVPAADVLTRHGIDPGTDFVLFLGRISRQKGIRHFLRAAARLDQQAQIVLCAAAPDSPEFDREVEREVARLRESGRRLVWIREMIERDEAIALYSGAAVFCCPSVYEPFGIINLEAMACETPVVATSVGGIQETVVDGETGYRIPFEPESRDDPEPADPEHLAQELAAAIDRLLADPSLRNRMGRAGRKRVVHHYGWDPIAERVLAVYHELIEQRTGEEP